MKTKVIVLILLFLFGPAFGVKEIQVTYDDGYQLYALTKRPADGYIWDVGDSQFEAVGTWNDARAGECDISLTGYDAELYMADFPAAAAGRYLINIYLRAGANPAVTDPLLGAAEIVWNGSAEKTIIDTSGRVDVGLIEGSDATDAINAEADTALTDYDPPTKAEIDARTLVAANYFDPSNDTVDVGLIEGSDATNQINAEADTALSDYDSPTKAELDTGLAGLNDPTAQAVVDALMADTGITAGGTWTYEEWCKAVGAYLIGTWRDKSGTSSKTQEILDAEDDATVILELGASETSPYKTTTKK